MEKAILQTKNLCKDYKKQRAVDEISLSVKENSIYGLLGPNGAGKSTLLKMFCGMLKPTSGEILFEGRPWQREDLKQIGALIEAPPLYENLTAKENLQVRTTILGLPPKRINEVLTTVDLTIREETGGSIFLGMKQRSASPLRC